MVLLSAGAEEGRRPVGNPGSGKTSQTGTSEMALAGWAFEVEEVSAGVYRVDGQDEAGRSVSRTGTDQWAVLDACERDARSMTGSG